MLVRLAAWADDTWQMRIAYDKCFAHILSSNHVPTPMFKYAISGVQLDWSILGITLDNNLNFEKHISQIVHNANVRAALIVRSFASRDPTILVKAYTTHVRPVLEYCTPVWSPHNIGLIKKLESVQKKFTKKLLSFTNTDSNI